MTEGRIWDTEPGREIVAKVLEGFDKGVFVRDVSRDSDSHWAVRALPYLVALSKLAELPAVLAASEQRGKNWEDTAAQESRNRDYYRSLVVEIGAHFHEVYVADDGGHSDDVLCAKVPEIVRANLHALQAQLQASERVLERANKMILRLLDTRQTHHAHGNVTDEWIDAAADARALASPGSPQEKGKTE